MKYIFIINGREDKRKLIEDEIKPQIEALDIKHEVYYTTGEGDATRFVRIYCDFHADEETCFVACGGNGTLNEIINGMVNVPNKSVAPMGYGAAGNFVKYFSGRNFRSVRDIVEGETMQSDLIKCNNDYSINVANFGFDAMSAYYGDQYVQSGKSKPYLRGTLRALLFSRFNNFRIVADGERMSKGLTMFCVMANASQYGEDYIVAPDAKIDDGYIDVVVSRFCPLAVVGVIFNKFKDGTYVDSKFCRTFLKFKKARHLDISCRNLIYLCLDGEITVGKRFSVDVVEHAITLRLPKLSE